MATQSRIWLFVNSSVGLLLIGFLLTTVLGTLLTYQIEEAALEHKIRFSSLYKDRGIAMREIYQNIVGVEEALLSHEKLDRTKIKGVETSVRDLRRLYENSRIYFTEKLSNQIDNVCTFYEKRLKIIIESQNSGRGNYDGFNVDLFIDDVDEAIYEMETGPVRRQLEKEFRIILGVSTEK